MDVYEFSVDYGPFNNPVVYININKSMPLIHDYFMFKYGIKPNA